MKKKIEALLKDGSLAGNAEYGALFMAQQSAKRAFEKAKKEKSEAKNAYRDALDNGEKDHDRLFELLTACRQAKFMQLYHRAAHKLAKYRLTRWLEGFLKNTEVPHEPAKARSAKASKAGSAKTEKNRSASAAKANPTTKTTTAKAA
jgi:hypothetical protein